MRVERERSASDVERTPHVRPATGRRDDSGPSGHPHPAAMSATDVLHLQRTAGNQAVSQSLQRAPQDEPESSNAQGTIVSRPPGGGLRRLVPDAAEARPAQDALLDRLSNGPVFSEAEISDLKRQDAKWLGAIGTGSYQDAVAYAERGEYYDWLKLKPGKRLLIATVEWRERLGHKTNSPAFTLGRQLTLRGGALSEQERSGLEGERDEQIRESFVRTLDPESADSVQDSEAQRKNLRANLILTNIFLILQNGLQVYDDDAKKHVDYTQGDVARALAHGGRVNIRIPALGDGEESATDLPDWLGVTTEGKNPNKDEKRDYATHYMSISGAGGKFEERGGMVASVRNKLPRPDDEQVRMWGLPLAADGMGRHDFNGDVILPDNSHGHMLLIFTPPQRGDDGALEVGLETIGPGGKSPVGHKHDVRSTEANANPESSFYGHKKEKIGGGKLKDNQRYVPLVELKTGDGAGWQAFLAKVKADWEERLIAAGDDLNARQALYRQLVGKREGGFTPPGAAPGEHPRAGP